jgi:hypothetical protein
VGIVKSIIAGFIVASAVAVLTLASALNADARARGLFRPHASFHGRHFANHFGNNFGNHFANQFADHRGRYDLSAFPFGGGLYGVPPDMAENVTGYPALERVVFVPEAPRALTCQHSVQTVTVAAEAGGTRDITITRC